MTIQLTIPDSVAQCIRLPELDIESRLRHELAVALYAQEILPLSKAAELAGFTRETFAELVARRGIPLHYSEEDLANDIAYARGQ